MADPAHEATDEAIRKLSKRLHANYNRAYREMSKRHKALMRGYSEQDEAWRARAKAGEATEEEHKAWRRWMTSDVAWYGHMVDTLASDLATCDEQATAMINGEAPGVYAENHNYGTFQVEGGVQVDTAYTLVDQDAVTVLLRDQPDLLPRLQPHMSRSERWARRKITSAITQSVLLGDSVPRASKRLRSVVEMDARAATRAARTALTGAENAGRVGAYRRAQGMGIGVRKQWMATLDERTRDSHRELDGETVGVEERFSNGLMYPGDPSGPAGEVWNCRCTLVADVEGVDTSRFPRPSEVVDVNDPEAYAKWKAGHKSPAPRTQRVMSRPDSEQPELSGFRWIGPRSTTSRDKLAKANPHFSEGREYQVNCQRTVVAYELRHRGYDVQARPYDDGDHIKDSGVAAWDMNGGGLWYRDKDLKVAERKSQLRDLVSKAFAEWGDEARALVRIKWTKKYGGGGHFISVRKVGGAMVYEDPQSNEALDINETLKKVSTSRCACWFMRVDNRNLSKYVGEAVENAE